MSGLTVSAAQMTDNVCRTEVCKRTANSILEYIDFNVDPCQDFYQYACGSWIKNTAIPEDKASIATFSVRADQNTDIIAEILAGAYEEIVKVGSSAHDFRLQEAEAAAADKENFEKLQIYYQTCMDTKSIDALGPTPVFPGLVKILSAFPDTEGDFSSNSVQGLTQALIALQEQGVQPLLGVYVVPDDKQPDVSVVTTIQPDLGLPSKEYYENQQVLSDYRSGLVDVVSAVLGQDAPQPPAMTVSKMDKAKEAGLKLLTRQQITDMVQRVVEFEIKLANITLKQEELQDPFKIYNPMSLTDVQTKYPVIDWQQYLRHFVPSSVPVPDEVIVATPSFFDALTTWFLSGEEESVSLQTLQDFMVIHDLRSWIYAMDTHTREVLLKMNSKISSGVASLPPRSRDCVYNANGAFGQLVGRYFAMNQFGGDQERARVGKLVDLIHQVWLNRLSGLDWLDKKTRAAAIEKINKIKHKVAYSIASPDDRLPLSLRDYYKGLEVNSDSFFANEERVTAFVLAKNWGRMGKPVDKNEWFMNPQEVNAYYSPSFNEIVVPAGILQLPFHDVQAPEYMNYGSIGAIIGHELTHAFDSAGRMYDGDGKLEQWWTNTTADHFVEKSQCFIDQYSGFTVKGPNNEEAHVNGKMTLGENLADNGGLSAAYQAFQQVWSGGGLLTDGAHYRLPGIDLSPEALFYVSYGRTWCNNMRPEAALRQVYTDVHSPSAVRVNGAVQNSADFAKVFNCPAKTPMNPEQKCQIW